jgi:hypothetical protein
MSVHVGAFAGPAGACFSIRKWQETNGGHEMAYTSVVFAAVFLLTLQSWHNARLDSLTALINGLGWGVTILFNATFLAVLSCVRIAGGIRFIKVSGS